VDTEMFLSSRDGWVAPWVLDVETVESPQSGPPAGRTDLEVAIALTRLLYNDFVSYGTDGQGRRLDDEYVPLVMKAHRTVLERLALKPPVWPFRALGGPRGFGTYWRANGMSGSRQARRDCVEQMMCEPPGHSEGGHPHGCREQTDFDVPAPLKNRPSPRVRGAATDHGRQDPNHGPHHSRPTPYTTSQDATSRKTGGVRLTASISR
jgi:hypothetical protein